MNTPPHELALIIKEYFQRRYRRARAPARADDITEAERLIELEFPPLLRELYLLCDGLGGPLGAWYLGPLFGDVRSLVEMTKEIRYLRPKDADGFIFFGENAANHPLGLMESASGLLRIVYFHEEAPAFLDLGNDLLQVYIDDEKQCERDIENKREE